MNTVIQGLFHLTSELADDAIGWVGGIGRQNIGKDTEGKVHGLFVAGGRFAGGAANETARVAKLAAGAGLKSGSGGSATGEPVG